MMKNQRNVFETYQMLKEKFEMSSFTEQQNLRFKINDLNYRNLNNYIENFKTLLAEYISLGEQRMDAAIHDSFIQKIKFSPFKIHYNLYKGKNIDDIIDFFREIAVKENETRNNKRYNQNNINMNNNMIVRIATKKEQNATFVASTSTSESNVHDLKTGILQQRPLNLKKLKKIQSVY